jgi:diguanylate cyclase (GGDEF)-like protein/PAS domain S-box-containing protein
VDDYLDKPLTSRLGVTPKLIRLRQVEGREWWLWGFAVVVTLVLTFAILSLTFPDLRLLTDNLYALSLKEWVRGLAALVLLFDVYTVFQHLQLQRIRHEMAENDQIFELITENAADMIAVVDSKGRRLYSSPAYHRVLGYSPEELAATSSLEQIHPEDRIRVLEAATKARVTGFGERLEYRFRHKNGSWRVLESTASVYKNSEGEAGGLVIVNRDITERKRAEDMLAHHAFYDGLTNLPNRTLFLDRLQRAITASQRHADLKFAVLFIDIDEFRVFNDSLGHAAGDGLLIAIAQRIADGIRDADSMARPRGAKSSEVAGESTLARPGGDEFVVLAEELHDPSDAVRIADRIQRRLADPFNLDGQQVVVSVSIGIAFSGNERNSAADMIRDAEIAMYRAKHAGKSSREVFDSAMHAGALKRLQLETDIRKGLELGEFRVHYQPIVSLRDGHIVAFEALSRWQRPEGLVMPGELIPVADQTGLILPINSKLMEEACQQVRAWQTMFPSDPPLALGINITPKQFAQPDLAEQIGEILKKTGMDPSCIDLEITETIAMADAEKSGVVLAQLKALGVRLNIDDFGTGFSSLSRLQAFPVDTLKIDRAFINGMDHDHETHEIVRIIVMLAHNLGMKVVAEGVERQQQVELLTHIGCELAQGYLFAKPVDSETIQMILESDRETGSPRAKAAASAH